MAGAGYKLFNTGDVLTAAQVNTYLQEQTVMVFADAAARTTALSSVLAEGMITYLKSTDAVEVYNGSAWVGVAGASSPLTTKGDLYTYSTTNARLAVGNNGETLVADSSATTGLRWQGNFAAGKNKIINGDFRINQRAFSSTTSTVTYTFDRFKTNLSGGTVTYSAQTFTPGTAPVAGYEAINFLRIVTSGQASSGNYARIDQFIEDVRTLAGQTATISFWAKASTGTPFVGLTLEQSFGSGGSADVTTIATRQAITSSWARYSFTVSIPSISGKTIGTGSYLAIELYTSAGSGLSGYSDVGLQNVTIDTWGWQVEAGNVATAFQTATGTLAGELAACQRYYWRVTADASNTTAKFGNAGTNSSTTAYALVNHPVPMRVIPTSIDYASLAFKNTALTQFTASSVALTGNNQSLTQGYLTLTCSGMTANQYGWLESATSSSGYIGFSAEF